MVVEVHLPVARHQRGACGRTLAHRSVLQYGDARGGSCPRGTPGWRRRRWRCGRTRPRRSRGVRTAAAESPPPTTVSAVDLGEGLGDGPGARGEGRELEHAHRAVPEDGLRVGDLRRRTAAPTPGRCPGRSGRPGWRRRRRRRGRRRPRTPSATTMSAGSTISTPAASACSR